MKIWTIMNIRETTKEYKTSTLIKLMNLWNSFKHKLKMLLSGSMKPKGEVLKDYGKECNECK